MPLRRKRDRSVELLPCPKCGMLGGHRIQSIHEPVKYYVVCDICRYRTKAASTLAAASKRWNTESRKVSDNG